MKKKGSRIEVMNGIAEITGGGLKKKDLMYKDGKIISKKMNKKKIYKQRGGDDDCRDLAYGVYNALHEDDKLNPTNSNNDNKVLEYITKNKKFGDAVLTGNDIPDFMKYIAGEINTFNEAISSNILNNGKRWTDIRHVIMNDYIDKYKIYNKIYSFLKHIKEKNTNFYIDYNDKIDNFIVTFEMIKSHKNTNKHKKLSLANIGQIERQQQGQQQGQQGQQKISFLDPNRTQNNRLGVAEQEETEIMRKKILAQGFKF